MNDFADVTLAILAGGAGSRMGKPKSLLTIGGVPILEHLHRRLAFPGPMMLVTAPGRERPPGHALYSAEVSDPVLDAGPMMGILTAARATRTTYLLVTAVDMPNVTLEGLSWLIAALSRSEAVVAMMSNGSVEPLPMALRLPDCLPLIEGTMASGRSSLKSLSDGPRASRVSAEGLPPTFWANLNCPEDLKG